MHGFLFFSIVAIAWFSKEVSAKVTELTRYDFDPTVYSGEVSVVYYYTPDCEHCKDFDPVYARVARMLEDTDAVLGKLDCIEESLLCEMNFVKTVPTIHIFVQKDRRIYSGPRAVDPLFKTIQKLVIPPLVELSWLDEVNQFKEATQSSVIVYLSEDDEDLHKSLAKAGDALRGRYRIGVVNAPKLAKRDNVLMPGLAIFKHYNEEPIRLESAETLLDTPALVNFIIQQGPPTLGIFNEDVMTEFVNAGKPLLLFFTRHRDNMAKLHQQFYPTARKYKDVFSMAMADTNEFETLKNRVMSSLPELPPVMIHDTKLNYHYVLHLPLDDDTVVTPERVRQFIEDYQANRLRPLLRSQPISEHNLHQPYSSVKTVVGSQFVDTVMDPTKDVFINLHSPDCKHSKAFNEIWNRFGDLIQGDILLASMDSVANQLPLEAGQVYELPSLRLYKAESNEMIQFVGDRTVPNLLDFLQKHATLPWKFTPSKDMAECEAMADTKWKDPFNQHSFVSQPVLGKSVAYHEEL